MSYRVVGAVQFPDDVMHARIEVCTWTKQAEGIKGGIVYLVKFREGQIGERSVGMSADVARKAAALLMQAAQQIEETALCQMGSPDDQHQSPEVPRPIRRTAKLGHSSST